MVVSQISLYFQQEQQDKLQREQNERELQQIQQRRVEIEQLALEAEQRDLIIQQEYESLLREKERTLERYNEAKRQEELAFVEQERIKDAKHELNLRFAKLPKRSDPDHQAYLRKIHGAPGMPVKPFNHIRDHSHEFDEEQTDYRDRNPFPPTGHMMQEYDYQEKQPTGPKSGNLLHHQAERY